MARTATAFRFGYAERAKRKEPDGGIFNAKTPRCQMAGMDQRERIIALMAVGLVAGTLFASYSVLDGRDGLTASFAGCSLPHSWPHC
jgi:hypothetical protein